MHLRLSGAGLVLCSLVASTGLALLPQASAHADPGDLVISEAYGGGGNVGATLTHDFVELYNPTDSPVSLDGWSVQYRSAGGSANGLVTPLSGSIPAGGHYLVQQAQGNGGSEPLPEPDAVGTTAMAGGGGQVWLASTTTPLDPPPENVVGNPGTPAAVVDLVGFAANAASYEGNRLSSSPSNSTAATRDPDGTDTDDNHADFTIATPTPTNSGAEGGGGGGEEPPAPTPTDRTIAEIQGTGSASPFVGDQVTTRGVVTAAYPTGGLDGFNLQTAGTGGGDHDARTASDGIFVYTGSADIDVAVGDHLAVTGKVVEFNGLTEISTFDPSTVRRLDTSTAPVIPAAVSWPTTDAARERLEGMLLDPQGDFTVTDNWSTNRYAEIGIAQGNEALRQPTDVAPFGSAEAAAVAQRNSEARVTLDDGSSIDFLPSRPGSANQDIALPWLTDDPTIRVGEPVTFVRPVVLSYGFGLWRLQPTAQLTAGDENGVSPATFGDTRTAAPDDVGGALQVASFNVLNYFSTTGDELDGCNYYLDRDDDPVSVRGGCLARGAAEEEDLLRQQSKIVRAINALDAEVVSLSEIENSAFFDKPRDAALADLVEALNAAAGADEWSYVRTPPTVPGTDREDVIRNGFIYRPAAVTPIGPSHIYDGPEFDNARDPLAQVFQPADGGVTNRFLLIVNHFKSKGSAPARPNPNADHGQGGWNVARVAQAEALVRFADELKERLRTPKVYLDGDINSYSFEDPMLVLRDAGYTSLQQRFDADPTYLFGGLVGSLDHALANDAALDSTTGADVWNINSVESVALEYSRHNYNLTDFFDATTPFRSSDHDPIVFGVAVSRRD